MAESQENEARATWCRTCGNPVGGGGGGECACWCLLADALQRYLGMDFDGSAQMAHDLWDQEADRERVWAADYADDHDVPVYPDERQFAPAEVRERDARNYPHDDPCPRCGRRQWGVGYDDPTDEQQETCSACGYPGAPAPPAAREHPMWRDEPRPLTPAERSRWQQIRRR